MGVRVGDGDGDEGYVAIDSFLSKIRNPPHPSFPVQSSPAQSNRAFPARMTEIAPTSPPFRSRY